MKHFIYRTDLMRTDRSGNRTFRVTICQVTRDKKTRAPMLKHIATREYQYESEFQAVLNTLEPLKPNPLPRKAYARHPHTSGFFYGVAWTMTEAGIAAFSQV